MMRVGTDPLHGEKPPPTLVERLYAEQLHRRHFARPRWPMIVRAAMVVCGLYAIAALVAAGR